MHLLTAFSLLQRIRKALQAWQCISLALSLVTGLPVRSRTQEDAG